MRSRAAGPVGHPKDDDRDWSPATNAAFRELLDHLADELAREYVRLMKEAAAEPSWNAPADERHGGST